MQEQRRRLLADGIVAGLIGYLTVAIFFAVANVAVGRSAVHTAALLGEALFWGLRDPASVVIDPGPVLAFNGVHLLAFMAFGFFAAWLVYEIERHPDFWYLAFFLFLGAAVLSYAGVLALTVLAGALVSPWLVVASSLLGAVAMAVYLGGTHRSLVRAVLQRESRLGTVD